MYPLTVSGEALPITSLTLMSSRLSFVGSNVASTASTRVMLDFAAQHSIKPQIEKFPMTQQGVIAAMQKLRDGKMRYRGVLVVE